MDSGDSSGGIADLPLRSKQIVMPYEAPVW
ncbi:hypothetical protein LMG28727_03348 [Paraburkholderia kirstenboschensis]|nr:hypothetical protein LMG28727_03348 [Paraburkholderia kirstenboschensis]